jgi:hypothetical protein
MSNYICEIANLYLARRGGALVLSPMDYAVIAEWERQEIPLRIILRSMNDVFDNLAQNNRRPVIKSLNYFQEAIDENYQNWLQMQVGK